MFETDQISVIDGFFPQHLVSKVQEYFTHVEWKYGTKSVQTMTRDSLPHWSKYFFSSENMQEGVPALSHIFEELVIQEMYEFMKPHLPPNSRLLRCYANGQTYGTDSKLHHDDSRPGTFTILFYPMETWRSDWAGETIFWNRETQEIDTSIHPKSNRLVIFPATFWHGARPVSRYCEALRITLMWKFII
jgi:hypothetical protein